MNPDESVYQYYDHEDAILVVSNNLLSPGEQVMFWLPHDTPNHAWYVHQAADQVLSLLNQALDRQALASA